MPMLKIFAVVGAVVVVGIAVVLILAAMKPDQFRVQRTAAIKAPSDKIFPLIKIVSRDGITTLPDEKVSGIFKQRVA